MRIRLSPGVREQLAGRRDEAGVVVEDRDYVDFVRQFRRSDLVSMVAAAAPAVSFNQADYKSNNTVTPWGLADVARVSLTFGSDHRNRLEPTENDLRHALVLHNNLGHPRLGDGGPELPNMMLQLVFSQSPFQRTVGQLTGRSIALFDQTTPAEADEVEVLRGDWQTDLLGCSLIDYIGVTQLLMAAAAPNNGRFLPDWIERDDLTDLTEIFDPAVTRHVLDTHLVADAQTFAGQGSAPPSVGRRFTFNPLVDHPVVSGLGPELIMPVPDYLAWKPTPYGIYYAGLAKWGEAFSHDLGRYFEAYVGRQLHLLPGVEVYPEITYRHRKEDKKSVDWIVVFPELVLLVEAKARRSTEALRSGSELAGEAIQGALNKGHRQLERTLDLIKAGTPEFAHIPADRPVIGFVVTLEDYLVVNSILHLPMYSPATKLPALVVAIEELEGIVGLGHRTASFIQSVTQGEPGRAANLRQALSEHKPTANPILGEGIEASPINRVRDVEP